MNANTKYKDSFFSSLFSDSDSLKELYCALEGITLEIGGKLVILIELIVRVININQGRNEGIIRKCKTLNGYCAFVEKVREYEREGRP